ncbi:MAG: DoxX family protein [Friedmanniella sp.]|nr:DoxX family protein [Friedmanniella sp.]
MNSASGTTIVALILTIALAGTYLGAGLVKLLRPREKLTQQANFAWARDYTDQAVKGIGLAEVLGAVGLVVPWYTHILPFLTPVAAVALAVLQALAMRVHLRRGENKVLPANAVLLLLALVLAVLRFAQL